MKRALPTYLRCRTDGHALEKSMVTEGDVRITAITPRLIRIEQGEWTDAATLRVLHRAFCPVTLAVQRMAEGLRIDTGALLITLRADGPLMERLSIQSNSQPYFLWHFGQKPQQNLKGTVSTLDEVNGACELEDGLCARDGFAFFEDGRTPEFTEDGWFAPRVSETDVYFFGYGHDYRACIQDFQRLTGAAELLPAFALGNWWSRYHAYTQQEYLGLMDTFASKDVPLSVGIIDMDWHLTRGENRTYGEGWTGYTWNEALFPDPDAFLRDLHARGLKTALNLHPALGVRPYEQPYEQMAKLMGRTDGKTIPFNCLKPQFLKAYFEALHFPMEQRGVDFWWMDWQQGTDYEKIAGDSLCDEERRIADITPLWMLNHMHMIAARRNGGRGMIFSRYAGLGSGRNPIGFSGDTFSTWESLRFQPYFTATASNVGYGWWSHDIGGHMGGVRDDELTTRWVQLGVFSPIFRLHSTDHPFNTREPWHYNPRAELVMERFMRLRHRLFPYLYTMNRRSSTEQLPLIMPMYYTHPDCEEAYNVPNEYWFGTELIAAPITERADASDMAKTDVWLPEGLWTDAMTGFVCAGSQRFSAVRPLEEMPLFLKAGAIVPMQAHITGQNTLGGAEQMELWIAPGADNAFTLYEDDGESLGYREGSYCETHITLSWTDKCAMLRVHPAKGETTLIPSQRTWTLRLRGFRDGTSVLVNGEPCRADYDGQTATLTLTVNAATEGGFTVELRHPDWLTSDNSNVRERAMTRIMRAQIALNEKKRLLADFEAALADIDDGRSYRVYHINADTHPHLGRALEELLSQRQRMLRR